MLQINYEIFLDILTMFIGFDVVNFYFKITNASKIITQPTFLLKVMTKKLSGSKKNNVRNEMVKMLVIKDFSF